MLHQATNPTLILFVVSIGASIYAALCLFGARSTIGGQRPSPVEPLFVALVGTVIISGTVATILASVGLFTLQRVALLILFLAGVTLLVRYATGHSIVPGRFGQLGGQEWLLVGLLVICSLVYFRPHEYILGGADAGTYMNMAAFAARTGNFVERDEWTARLVERRQETLREQRPGVKTRFLQFVGWYIDDDDSVRTVPQFYLFHPALLAIGVSLGGLWGGLLVTPIWGVLSVAALFLAARRVFDSNIGLLAALLLAVTPTHIFFSRYPTTEPLTLLLIFAGLLAFQKLWDDPDAGARWGVFGGAAIGAALLTRIDLPLVLLIIVVGVIWRKIAGHWHRGWTAFSLTLGIFVAQLAYLVVTINWPYFWNVNRSIMLVVGDAVISALMLVVGGLFLLAILWRRGALRSGGWLRSLLASPWTRWFLALSVVALSAYAYFLRPLVEPVRFVKSWPAVVSYPRLDSLNWVRMGWYLTPLGLLLATLGLAEIIRKERLGRIAVFLAIGTLTTLQYVYNVLNTPYHIYVMRRYVPVVIPMLMLFAAVAILAVYRTRPSRATAAVSGLLALALVGGMIYQARFVLPQRDYAGAVAQLTGLQSRLEPEALLLIAEPAEKIFADTFGVPLHYIFGHDVVVIRDETADVGELLGDLLGDGGQRSIQLLAVDPLFDNVRKGVALEPLEMVPFSVELLQNSYDAYPSVMQTAYYGIEIYNVEEIADAVDHPGPHDELRIDIGEVDAAYILDGFYGKELIPGAATMRWTSDEANVEIPNMGSEQVELSVRAMIYRPEEAPPAPVQVWLDDYRLGEFTPEDQWQTYTFDGPIMNRSGSSTLRFETTTFNPEALGVNNDSRNLGFLIDEVIVQAK